MGVAQAVRDHKTITQDLDDWEHAIGSFKTVDETYPLVRHMLAMAIWCAQHSDFSDVKEEATHAPVKVLAKNDDPSKINWLASLLHAHVQVPNTTKSTDDALNLGYSILVLAQFLNDARDAQKFKQTKDLKRAENSLALAGLLGHIHGKLRDFTATIDVKQRWKYPIYQGRAGDVACPYLEFGFDGRSDEELCLEYYEKEAGTGSLHTLPGQFEQILTHNIAGGTYKLIFVSPIMHKVGTEQKEEGHQYILDPKMYNVATKVRGYQLGDFGKTVVKKFNLYE